MNISTDFPLDSLTLQASTNNLATALAAPKASGHAPADMDLDGDLVAPDAPANDASDALSDVPPFDRRQQQAAEGQTERRKSIVNRRLGLDRRVVDIGAPTGLERRRGPGRRRSDDRRSAEEGEMTDEQFEFMLAIDTYKRLNNRPFPTWTEILEVVKQLGYRKVAASTIVLSKATGRSG